MRKPLVQIVGKCSLRNLECSLLDLDKLYDVSDIKLKNLLQKLIRKEMTKKQTKKNIKCKKVKGIQKNSKGQYQFNRIILLKKGNAK